MTFENLDVLLTLSQDLFFTCVWTDELLDEWERISVQEGLLTSQAARSVSDARRMYFDKGRIDGSLYRDKDIEHLSPDPISALHVAACIYGGVDVLLTRKLENFQSPALAEAGVSVMTADVFLTGKAINRNILKEPT